MERRKLIAGNWKMHGTRAMLDMIESLAADIPADVDVALFPPNTLIVPAMGRGITIGAQDCHADTGGAHTGDVSAAMVAEAGATMVIVGHSERRADHGETDADVRAKAEAAIAAGLTPIICVGETALERDAGEAVATVTAQLKASLPGMIDRIVVAYEPIWAIGTGRTPTADDVGEMHAAIRAIVGDDVRVLYGGSVKPANAAALLAVANVDGALVGGASLTIEDFLSIVRAGSSLAGTTVEGVAATR